MLAGRRCCFCPVLLSGIITLPNIAYCFLLLACGSTLLLDTLRYLVRYTNLCNLLATGKLPRLISWTFCVAIDAFAAFRHLDFLVWNICSVVAMMGNGRLFKLLAGWFAWILGSSGKALLGLWSD